MDMFQFKLLRTTTRLPELRLTRCLICLIALLSISLGECAVADVASSVIVVRPKAWERALDEWVKYRQRDYQVIAVDSVASARDLKQSILKAIGGSKLPVAAVLLCGDVGIVEDGPLGKKQFTPITPTFEWETKVKLGPFTTPSLVTDVDYGDIDGDHKAGIAISGNNNSRIFSICGGADSNVSLKSLTITGGGSPADTVHDGVIEQDVAQPRVCQRRRSRGRHHAIRQRRPHYPGRRQPDLPPGLPYRWKRQHDRQPVG